MILFPYCCIHVTNGFDYFDDKVQDIFLNFVGCHALSHRCLQLSLLSHIHHVPTKTLNGTPYLNQNELICNNAIIQAQNIKKTQTSCTMKSYVNKEKLAKQQHIMFWNFKSLKKDLRSQSLCFIPIHKLT
jgi:hypothetical protein